MYDPNILTEAIGRFASDAPVAYALVSSVLATVAGLASQRLLGA
jgi:hypothetical protein